jgi:hypothetical protein
MSATKEHILAKALLSTPKNTLNGHFAATPREREPQVQVQEDDEVPDDLLKEDDTGLEEDEES